ncbi:MAG: FRG domain-containing protein [Candidatus Methylumidiphilus sp.]
MPIPIVRRLLKTVDLDYLYNSSLGTKYLLADTDYGIVLLPPNSLRKNAPLDFGLLQRYAEKYPYIAKDPSRIFDIGYERGYQAFYGHPPSSPYLITLNVTSREQLDTIIATVRKRAESKNQFQLWFRGQPQEYLLSNMIKESRTICPWRSVQDISQVPSLYRNTNARINDLKSYCMRILEIHKYYLFLKEILGIPTLDTRVWNDPLIEKVPNNLNRDVLDWTVTLTTASGELIENHDTHQAYRSLQASLFLQHYGLESNILDITNNIDIALFFAQKEIENNKYINVDFSKRNPVIYLFILDNELDPFLNTSKLMEDYRLLRPQRQNCGILSGASMVSKNYYTRFIALRLILNKRISMKYEDPEYLFPDPAEDKILGNLIEFSNLQKMTFIKPFVLAK